MQENFRQSLNNRFSKMGGKLTEFHGYLIELNGVIIPVTSLEQAAAEASNVEAHLLSNLEITHANT